MIIDDDAEIVNMMTMTMMIMTTIMVIMTTMKIYLTQVPAAMDGVPAPISMLTDPSTNPEAIALVSLSFQSYLYFHSVQVILISTQSKSS